MKLLRGILAIGAVLVMSGCSILLGTDVDPASTPAFLATPQVDEDVVTEMNVSVVGITPESTRFQGEWEGREVYLGVIDESTVALILGVPGAADTWGTMSSSGNVVLGFSLTEEVTLKYLPQGTGSIPEGWEALSDFVITRT
jgi:hypothetical protein